MEKGLSQEGLKILACVTMLVDHAALLFGGSPWLRAIGRLAFPIYCFLLTEGIRHTRDVRRYLSRLLFAAIVSEPIYDLVLYPCVGIWQHQNVLWTLALGCAMLWCMTMIHKPVAKLAVMLLFALAAQLVRASYGSSGIYMIALFALCREAPEGKWALAAGLLVINWLMGSFTAPVFGLDVPVQLFAELALVPIFLYSGEKRTRLKAVSWGFYLFYPAHLLLLWGIAQCATGALCFG